MKLVYLKEGRKYGVEELRACILSQLKPSDDAGNPASQFFEKADGKEVAAFFDRFKEALNRIKKSVAGDGQTIARKLTNGRYVFRYVGLYDYVDIGNDSDANTRHNLTFFFMPKFVDFQEGTDCSGDLPDEEDDDSAVAIPDAKEIQKSWQDRVGRFASNNERNAVLLAIDRYNRELDLLGNPAGETKKHEGLLELVVRVLRDYLENGVYTVQRRELEHNGQGEIDWETTIDQYQPVFLKKGGKPRPFYMDYATELAWSDEGHYITRLHQCLVTTWGRKLEELGLSSVLRVNVPLLSEEELVHFGTKEYQLDQIQKEMGVQFVTKSRHTLSLMKELIEQMSESQSTNDMSLAFGMNGAEHLWEEACAKVLGSELNEPINKCGLTWEPGNSGATFREYMPRPFWKNIAKSPDGNSVEPPDIDPYSKKSGWRLDFIRTYPPKRKPTDSVNKLVILDAKYYVFSLDNKGKMTGSPPGIGDIAKQIFYQTAFKDLVEEKVGFVNAFLFPEDDNSQTYFKGDPKPVVSELVRLGWTSGSFASGFKDIPIFGVRIPGIKLLELYANNTPNDWFETIVKDISNEQAKLPKE